MQMNDKEIEEKAMLVGEKLFELFKKENYDPSICVTAMITAIFGLVHAFHKNPKQILIMISEDFLNMSQAETPQHYDNQSIGKKD